MRALKFTDGSIKEINRQRATQEKKRDIWRKYESNK